MSIFKSASIKVDDITSKFQNFQNFSDKVKGQAPLRVVYDKHKEEIIRPRTLREAIFEKLHRKEAQQAKDRVFAKLQNTLGDNNKSLLDGFRDSSRCHNIRVDRNFVNSLREQGWTGGRENIF